MATSTPAINHELLDEWSREPKLSFSRQDEDLLLADRETLPLLLTFVQRRDILASKRSILLSALCVLIFDNTPDPDDPHAEGDFELAATVAEFLSRNSWLFSEINDDYIYDYIKAEVYPQIGRIPNAT